MSPPSISPEKSQPPPSDTSLAIVAFEQYLSSSSPSPPHSLDHSSESEADKCQSKEETQSPNKVIHNLPVKEFAPPPLPAATEKKRSGRGRRRRRSGGRDGQRSGAVLAILKRTKREEIVKFSALGFRLSEVVLSLISFSIMASDRTKGWSGDSFDRYKEYRFCLSVNVVAFVYSAFQACDLAYHLVKEKHFISHHLRPLFEFIMDQVLAYLLLSASTAAVTRVDDWVTNWGKDDFTEMASASIAMSFLAFLAFAFSSLISGYNLFDQDSL